MKIQVLSVDTQLSVDTPLIWEKVLVKFILATPIRKRSVLYAAHLARTAFMTGLIQKQVVKLADVFGIEKVWGGFMRPVEVMVIFFRNEVPVSSL